MNRYATLCAVTAIAFTLSACNQTPPDTHDADVKTITALEAAWNQEYAAKDAAKISAHYADDAVLIEPGMAPILGKDAIQKSLTAMLSDPAVAVTFRADKVEVAKSGDLGYTTGPYTLTMTDPVSKQVVHDHGSYVTTYRKLSDGTWKAVADISSSSVPPAFPEATPAPVAKKK